MSCLACELHGPDVTECVDVTDRRRRMETTMARARSDEHEQEHGGCGSVALDGPLSKTIIPVDVMTHVHAILHRDL